MRGEFRLASVSVRGSNSLVPALASSGSLAAPTDDMNGPRPPPPQVKVTALAADSTTNLATVGKYFDVSGVAYTQCPTVSPTVAGTASGSAFGPTASLGKAFTQYLRGATSPAATVVYDGADGKVMVNFGSGADVFTFAVTAVRGRHTLPCPDVCMYGALGLFCFSCAQHCCFKPSPAHPPFGRPLRSP